VRVLCAGLASLPLVLLADSDAGLQTIRADALKGHVYFLASDEMGAATRSARKGGSRRSTSPAFIIATSSSRSATAAPTSRTSRWSRAQIDRSASYLRARVDSAAAGGGRSSRDYALGPDFTMGRQGSADVSVDGPVVFAGYGISAPEYQYDDFAGVNVAGKIVMVLNHEPQEGNPQSRFMGGFNTVHAYNFWKPEVIRLKGAAAILMVQEATNAPAAAAGERARPTRRSGPTVPPTR